MLSFAQVGGALLRAAALEVRYMRLPEDAADSGEHGEHQEGRGGKRELVAADELGGEVAEISAAGLDGAVVTVGLHVSGELLDGYVALLRFFAKGLGDDAVEVGVDARVDCAGARGRLLADDADHLFGGEVGKLVGVGAGEEYVEKDAERVGVGCVVMGRPRTCSGLA